VGKIVSRTKRSTVQQDEKIHRKWIVLPRMDRLEKEKKKERVYYSPGVWCQHGLIPEERIR